MYQDIHPYKFPTAHIYPVSIYEMLAQDEELCWDYKIEWNTGIKKTIFFSLTPMPKQ